MNDSDEGTTASCQVATSLRIAWALRSRAFVSVLLHPLVVGSAPLLWRDWSRRSYRRACTQLQRHQRVEVQVGPPISASLAVKPEPFSRAQRAHYRLCWQERLARNARVLNAGQVTIKLFGVPEPFAAFLGRSAA